MARFARVVVVDVAHHVTQRGNARQVILSTDADHVAYLELLRQYSELHGLALLGYCLMSNHVHLIAVPRAAEALAQALKHAHGRYASYWNARNSSSGHVWQGRFLSAGRNPFMEGAALRGVESGACRYGVDGSGVALVERGGALRKRPSRGSAGNGTLAEPLDSGRMEGASRRRGIGQRCGEGAAIHAYGKAAGVGRICCQPGTFDFAGAGSAKGRQAHEARARCQAGWLYLRCVDRLRREKEWGMSRLSSDF
jgi:REP element-mobilizing transposase RayT